MKKIRLRTPISILVFTLLGFQSQFSYATECPEGKVLGAHTKGCIPDSGICGNNCSYTIDEKGNLDGSRADSGVRRGVLHAAQRKAQDKEAVQGDCGVRQQGVWRRQHRHGD